MKHHNEALCPVWNHLATKAGIPCGDHRRDPVAVVENDLVKICWDCEISADHTLYRPDLVLYDKGSKTITVFDMTVPFDTRLEEAFHEKMTKYEPLVHQLARLWTQDGWKVRLLPMVVGALGTITKGMVKAILKHPAFGNPLPIMLRMPDGKDKFTFSQCP